MEGKLQEIPIDFKISRLGPKDDTKWVSGAITAMALEQVWDRTLRTSERPFVKSFDIPAYFLK